MNLIVCVDSHWGIGKQGKLLVDIPEDKHFFKDKTMGGVVLGGRKTMESLPGNAPLSGRKNILLTHKQEYSFGNAEVVHSVEEALESLKNVPTEQVYIIGGGTVYEAFLPYCECAYLTKVDCICQADTFFPNLDAREDWEVVRKSDTKTYAGMDYWFVTYHKRKMEELLKYENIPNE
ncbi:MAG: dihydrofolate reductase [Lachnospiraceae bacterium]|nr:dihydrofolate reductase [Lachnospiraceae bacterium]